MRAPRFWQTRPGVTASLLAPLGWLYAYGTKRRLARGARAHMPVPVICVGNLTAGGAGKTPTVIALATRLQAMGLRAHAVTRGYGGTLDGPVQVDPTTHRADATGDEALLLAAFLPCWVAKNRMEGAQAAINAGAEVIILDDGFQNPQLAYDLSILVADAHRGFGNGRVIPAGPLREPVGVGLKRADVILSIGPQKAQANFIETWGAAIGGLAHVQGQLRPLQTGLSLQNRPVIAFAGIGYPEKFFATLKDMRADIRATHALADHQPLSPALMARLLREARSMGAQIITTEKDAVRLPPAFRGDVMTIPVRLEIDDWAILDDALKRVTNTRDEGSRN